MTEPHIRLVVDSRARVTTKPRIDFEQLPYGMTISDLKQLQGKRLSRHLKLSIGGGGYMNSDRGSDYGVDRRVAWHLCADLPLRK